MNDSEFRLIADSNKVPGVAVEKDGVHFGCCVSGDEPPALLLYRRGTQEVAARLPFPDPPYAGGLYTMKLKLRPAQYEYNFCAGDEVWTDPCARLVAGRETFGQTPGESPHSLRGRIPVKAYDWEDDRLPQIPYDEAVMYHLHVRGYTMQKNSGVRRKGTFAGLREKIPYLKELGVNQVKLQPVYEFAKMIPKMTGSGGRTPDLSRLAPQVAQAMRQVSRYRMDYWGYGDAEAFYFAPKASYASSQHPDTEFKDMVKAFHRNKMEVLLEFSFPDEADFVKIERCLTYWAEEYHVDGFAVMARDSVSEELARLPLFRTRKLICSRCPEALRGVRGRLLAESNDSFMNDCRRVLKGDEQFLRAFSYQVRANPSGCAKINYMTNHDGFTLMDLVSYDRKYNMENGEYNHDGPDWNFSWNCGEEGPSRRKDIRELRLRQRKNAFAMLLFSQGTPMILAGDEFGNSQNGNNNPYCHDSELTWTDWSARRGNRELSDFVRDAVAYRRLHKILHLREELQCIDYRSLGYPDLSFHGERAWYGDFEQMGRGLGCLYCGGYADEEGFLYIAYNFNWTEQMFALPQLPKGMKWNYAMDTSRKVSFIPPEEQERLDEVRSFRVAPRTVVILEGRE